MILWIHQVFLCCKVVTIMSIYPFTSIHPFIHSSIHSFIHSFIYSFIYIVFSPPFFLIIYIIYSIHLPPSIHPFIYNSFIQFGVFMFDQSGNCDCSSLLTKIDQQIMTNALYSQILKSCLWVGQTKFISWISWLAMGWWNGENHIIHVFFLLLCMMCYDIDLLKR